MKRDVGLSPSWRLSEQEAGPEGGRWSVRGENGEERGTKLMLRDCLG